MHLKTLLFFITLAGGFLLSEELYAVNSRSISQDSIKKVTIKVIASEKPRELNFDSLFKSSQTAQTVKKHQYAQRTSKPTETSESVVSSSELENRNSANLSSESRTKQTKRPVENRGKTIGEQHQKFSPRTSIEDHAHEMQNAQVTDESTTQNEGKTARTYLWIGFMLIVVGVILAILFGRTALLVSIAGTIFVIIGYTI